MPDLDHPPEHLTVVRETAVGGLPRVRFVYRQVHGVMAALVALAACFGYGSFAFAVQDSSFWTFDYNLYLAVLIPFVSTFCLLPLFLLFVFGYCELSVEDQTVTSFIGIGRCGFRRRFVLTPETRITMDHRMTACLIHSPLPELFVQDGTSGKVRRYGCLASESALGFIAAYLRSVRR